MTKPMFKKKHKIVFGVLAAVFFLRVLLETFLSVFFLSSLLVAPLSSFSKAEAMNTQTILVVDDDAEIREGIRILLTGESYNIIEAEN